VPFYKTTFTNTSLFVISIKNLLQNQIFLVWKFIFFTLTLISSKNQGYYYIPWGDFSNFLSITFFDRKSWIHIFEQPWNWSSSKQVWTEDIFLLKFFLNNLCQFFWLKTSHVFLAFLVFNSYLTLQNFSNFEYQWTPLNKITDNGINQLSESDLLRFTSPKLLCHT
jgi:hypothetical protein